MTPWYQFSVYYPNARNTQFPLGCLVGFLPDFYKANLLRMTQWHFLFEPSLLVRVRTDRIYDVMASVEQIAKRYGLEWVQGDIAESEASKPPAINAGFEYNLEMDFYGALCPLNLDFLEVVSRLSLAVQALPPEKQLQMLSKHLHLLCNAFGLNYAEESRVMKVRSRRAAKFYMKVGRV